MVQCTLLYGFVMLYCCARLPLQGAKSRDGSCFKEDWPPATIKVANPRGILIVMLACIHNRAATLIAKPEDVVAPAATNH